MSEIEFNKLILNPKAGPDEQALALKNGFDHVDRFAKACVNTLESSSYPIIVADQLIHFGTILIPHLELLCKTTKKKKEVRKYAALLLHYLGDKNSRKILLEELDLSWPIIAHRLAADDFPGTKNKIEEILTHGILDEATSPSFASLLAAMRKLTEFLPLNLYSRFTAKGVPIEVRMEAEEFKRIAKS